MRALMTLLTDEEILRIHESTLQVLERTGVKIGSDKVCNLLVRHGAKAEGNIVKLPRPMVEEAVGEVQKDVLLAARDSGCDLLLPSRNLPFNTTSGYSPFVMDMETDEKRNSTGSDLKEFARLCDYLDTVAFFWPIVMPTEEETSELEELCSLDISLRNIRKHIQCSCSSEKAARWQIRLASVVAGGEENLKKRPIFSCVASPATPLTFEGHVAEAIVILAETGVPLAPMNVPLMGTTAPVTLAGTSLMANAEQLATLVILKTANPGAPMVYSTDAAPSDLKTGMVNYEGPEYPLFGAALGQMARYYGMPSLVAHGSSEERPFDRPSGFERNVLKVVMSLMTRTDLSAWIGSLDNSINASLVDVLVDTEACERAFAYLRRFEVNKETLALDAIAEAGPAGHFLAHKHTIKHFRKELWTKKLKDSFIFDTTDGESFRDQAKQKVKDILATHIPPAIDEDMLKEMDKVMQEARRDIIG